MARQHAYHLRCDGAARLCSGRREDMAPRLLMQPLPAHGSADCILTDPLHKLCELR